MELSTRELVVLTHALRALSDENIRSRVDYPYEKEVKNLMVKVTDEFLTPAPQ